MIIDPRYYILILTLLVTLGVSSLWSQSDTTVNENDFQIPEVVINTFKLFEDNEILELTLRFDITEYMSDKPDKEYLDALLTCYYNEQDSINKNIRLRARGNYRYRTCEFPPLRLNFKDTHFGFSDLDSLNNVKMVTHCFDNETYQTYLLREYLIYRFYNIVTDYSFRVRLLKVQYIDIGERGLVFEQYGFLIEPLDRILFRENAIEIEELNPGFDDIATTLIDRISLFQYMIGNSDWFIQFGHNFKFIKKAGYTNSKVIPIPYDFDYSGFVNAHYAAPSNNNIESISERVYMGPCRTEEEFSEILDEFKGYEDFFLNEVRNFEYLDRRVKKELINYIKSFYALYKKDNILDLIIKECNNNDEIDKN